ncbi:M1 family metallopeptidase [Marivirga salinae]|uniref:M1 family metallopeptidase n=1 Tax=Marivirga salinarum TaxID=3059078 RepID=A0AA51NC56_9BACT|nr:M1 family metallopeptidase [Marivirga sp. BDSF4-3]WMN10886.1 M1 family metallopeptidase [Marivirga sp. BDSF4-3]
MKYMRVLKLSVLMFLGVMSSLFAQEPQENNQDLFKFFGDRSGNEFRSASGKPGHNYWQNSADYKIDVTLDEENEMLRGSITINYTNNSPEKLEFVWLHLEQNRFTETSRGTLTTPIQGNRYVGDMDGGYNITNLKAVSGRRGNPSSEHIITDTRMQVFFDEPIEAKGGTATISMNFEYKIPVKGMDRMGQLKVDDGTIFAMAQWYPKMVVFDDVRGWNTEPYLGAGEFYLDYGDFEYNVTVPYDHIVVGSGELLNPKDVLTAEQQNRMAKAANSDETVHIITADEVGDPSKTRPKQSGNLTWKFKIENARDVAWGSSPAFIWDAAKIDLPSGKKAMAQSAYPKESDGEDGYGRSTEYSKASVEHYSNKWFEYPYPNAVNVAADIGGMEYPGLNFCGYQSKNKSLWGVTDHEFGHNWFPMIVGSNERLYAWMDEGFNTFINFYSSEEFNDGEFADDLDETRSYVGWLTSDSREKIATYPDVADTRNLGMIAYMKPAMGLLMLREYILGHERFDNAFTAYIERWAYKHPTPGDFFNTMENVSGESLSWFWKTWFYGNGNIDIALDGVYPYQGSYLLVLANKGEVPMPVKMKVTYTDGTDEMVELPVEIWQRGNSWNHLLTSGSKEVEKIEIDPDKILPDVNGSNDVWPSQYYEDK